MNQTSRQEKHWDKEKYGELKTSILADEAWEKTEGSQVTIRHRLLSHGVQKTFALTKG